MKTRLDLTELEYSILKLHLDFDSLKERAEEDPSVASLLNKLENPKIIKSSSKKNIAASNATEARTDAAKEKIENAINILRLENKKMTHYSISKTGNVSFMTVKKYVDDVRLEALNKLIVSKK